MRTSEDVFELGLYASSCCNQELIFDIGDTFCRCPGCKGLCDWELECKITPIDGDWADLSVRAA
jgi:hypothetical protein